MAPAARSVVLITIDTLRADRVGAYGLATARTPVLDALAREGARFARAYATAPITLPSHASLLTGRYPPGHGAHHNGVAMREVPTLASTLDTAGFATGAFVSAFPLDRRFGLARGFDVYDDGLGRDAVGQLRNERPGDETVTRAIAWLDAQRAERTFLWVHLFEPHAPYGAPGATGPALARYDDDVASADALTGRLLASLGDRAASTLVIVAADHGEAFGEHGEIGHSLFVYDTTLRVPLIVRGPRVPAGRIVDAPVSLVDVAPTLLALLGQPAMDTDGVSLVEAIEGKPVSEREIYAESLAPLFDFGWSPLRTVRAGTWKYIDAPTAELFDLATDASEQRNIADTDQPRAATLRARVEAMAGPEPSTGQGTPIDREARGRLEALGYVSGGQAARRGNRPDPKDRVAVAARLAAVMAGEVTGDARVTTLEAVLREDPGNPQAHLRLGYAYLESKRCRQAIPHLRAALETRLPSADAGLGLAGCLSTTGDVAGATAALREADALEPGNPVVRANLGLLALQQNDAAAAVEHLAAGLAIDASMLEARFALARALARLGRREEASREAATLLRQLPPDAPQRAEVERLVAALSPQH